ncbi:malate synthase G [Sphingomonas sp. Y38-1Y]|uniref:malate synthase G n=1 Tax=Sphingomonas sp. Y38-1Y TaxID=3078265 RepID=UPI0028E66746|nr:malate synthase G [Sphingomonas sp. Y38-1Y]
MTAMTPRADLSVAEPLARFIEDRVLPDLGLAAETFWSGAAAIFARFAPDNRALLAKRDALQGELDAWHGGRAGQAIDPAEYEAFLRSIGYLVDEPAPFRIGTQGIDPEVATIAGPQLVVPVLNARFLLNAANARWGSLYDALYGTDALSGPIPTGGYDAARGARVVTAAKAFLDKFVPLADKKWAEHTRGFLNLKDATQFVGHQGANLLFKHHGLHIEVVIDREHPIGATDPAAIADILLESALTTIVDLEDSVAAVDADDKVAAYANWLGLMKGDLEETFEKGGETITRALNPDRDYQVGDQRQFTRPGRSLLFVRNVGLLMTTPAIRLADGAEAPEGVLDAIVTSLIGLYDLRGLGRTRNSRAGSIYIVKPKLHGPQEAAFTNALFDAVEDLLGLDRHTIKIGVMDEERRTSANLSACIHAVKDRIAFINTGFLDRTGDEIHSVMAGGAVIPKGEMKTAAWLRAYEDRNVLIGLEHGFLGRAQIGKGMWAAPDRMADMLRDKQAQCEAGASTAWVPSPTAATLHALHYHNVDVGERQVLRRAETVPLLSVLLTPPLAGTRDWSREEVMRELDNNAQGILGYVVRWIDQGVGCSKVPDINDVGLMEDRATLRISSQLLANWLKHGVATRQEVEAALRRMAAKVDAQNAGDPFYQPMAGREDESLAFQAARALVFEGETQPSGYTEPLLHRFRAESKARRH